jgi:SPP1 family predicted phage head-tail adaptor
MDAGKLNKRITVERLTGDTDAIGQPVIAWVEFCKAWANIRYMTGAESMRSGADVSITKASIMIRERAGITEAMRVSRGGVIFQIKAILPSPPFMSLLVEVVK